MAPTLIYLATWDSDSFLFRWLGSVDIGLDDFGMDLENFGLVWIDDYPQPVDIGRAERLDAREAYQALARGCLAQRLIHAEIVGVAVG